MNFFQGLTRLSLRIHFILILVNIIWWLSSTQTSVKYVDISLFGLDPILTTTLIIITSGFIFGYVLGSFVFEVPIEVKENSTELKKLENIEKTLTEIRIKLEVQSENTKQLYQKLYSNDQSKNIKDN